MCVKVKVKVKVKIKINFKVKVKVKVNFKVKVKVKVKIKVKVKVKVNLNLCPAGEVCRFETMLHCSEGEGETKLVSIYKQINLLTAGAFSEIRTGGDPG